MCSRQILLPTVEWKVVRGTEGEASDIRGWWVHLDTCLGHCRVFVFWDQRRGGVWTRGAHLFLLFAKPFLVRFPFSNLSKFSYCPNFSNSFIHLPPASYFCPPPHPVPLIPSLFFPSLFLLMSFLTCPFSSSLAPPCPFPCSCASVKLIHFLHFPHPSVPPFPSIFLGVFPPFL